MPFRPIQWARRSTEGRQIEADGSRLVNFYAVQLAAPDESKVPVMLYSSPGLRRYIKANGADGIANANAAGVHDLLEIDSVVYGHWLFGITHQSVFFGIRVDPANGGNFQIDADYDPLADENADVVFTIPATHTLAYTSETDEAVPTAESAKMVTDGRNILFVNRNEVYVYDLGKTGGAGFITVRAPVPADLSTLEDLTEQDWVSCEWIDGYFLLAARSGQFFHSGVYTTTFAQLDFAEAGSNPDQIVGVEALNRRVYILGARTVEQWYNAGGADFAFSRDNSATLNVGCSAPDSIARDQFYITFLGNDGIVYAMMGSASRISTESVEYDIAQSDPTKARAFTYTEEGHRFYSLTLFMNDGTKKNWTFDFVTGVWHERTTTDILCATRWNKRHVLVGREGKDHIYDMRLDWGVEEHDDASMADIAIQRTAVSPRIFANLQRANMRSFQIDIPKREGADADNIKIEWSDDGKTTWKGGTHQDGTAKTYKLDDGPRIRVNRLGQIREGRNMRLTTAAQRRVDVLGAYVETDVWQD